MKTDLKTREQQKAYFLFHDWIAQEMNNQGITLDKLIINIQPKPTRSNLHEIFKSILYKMYGKDSTKGITREELNSCLEVYMEALAIIGVHIEFPDREKRSLLEYYN